MTALRQWDGAQWLDLGVQSINDLTDADTATVAPAAGDGLSWNGTNWVPAAPAAGTVLPTAGAGLTGGVASYDVGAGVGITVAADIVSLDKTYTDTLYAPVGHTHVAVEEVVVSGAAPTDPAADLWMDTASPDPTVALEERVAVLESLVASLTGGAS